MPAARFNFADVDDRDYVVENYRINSGFSLPGLVWSFQAGYAANWHPLTWMSHMLDCQLYGVNPGGPHVTNIVFHIFNAMLVFLVLQRMTGATWRSAMVAGLFAWHPMHVESVAWIAERKDVLSTFLWLLTIVAYVRHVEEIKLQGSKARLYYFAAVVLFALAIAAKPMVVTLPCLLLLLDWWPLRRAQGNGAVWPRLVIEKLPFFALSACCCAATIIAQHRGGAIASLGMVPLHFRLYNTVLSYWRYIGKLLVPVNLAMIYPITSGPRSELLAEAACFALFAVSTMAIRLRTARPYCWLGWFWFLGTLVPVIGLIQVGGQAMADRYTYVPSLGLFILLCWALSDWAINWKHGRQMLAAAAAVTLTACACLTARQLQYWRNGETLFVRAISVTRDNCLAHEAYAEYLVENDRWDEARQECRRALQIWKDFGDAHLCLGIILYHEGKLDEARQQILPVVNQRLLVERGEEYLGKIALAQHLPAEAEAAFSKELEFNQARPGGHCGLGQALAQQRMFEAAREEFEAALRWRPDCPEATYGLAELLRSRGESLEKP